MNEFFNFDKYRMTETNSKNLRQETRLGIEWHTSVKNHLLVAESLEESTSFTEIFQRTLFENIVKFWNSELKSEVMERMLVFTHILQEIKMSKSIFTMKFDILKRLEKLEFAISLSIEKRAIEKVYSSCRSLLEDFYCERNLFVSTETRKNSYKILEITLEILEFMKKNMCSMETQFFQDTLKRTSIG